MTLALGGSAATPGVATRHVVDAQRPQLLVPSGVWQRTLVSTEDALVSCLVSPGFDFEDFELA